MAEENQEDELDRDFKNFDPEYMNAFSDVIGYVYGCRMCRNYTFDRDAEEISCSKGYFNESGPGASCNEKDCNGKEFRLNPNTRWLRAVYHLDKDKIQKEVEGRILDRRVFKDIDKFSRERFYRDNRSDFRSIIRALQIWEVSTSTKEELLMADAIIAYAFGFGSIEKNERPTNAIYDPTIDVPGKSNEALADLIDEHLKQNKNIGLEDVFAQGEVADAFSSKNGFKRKFGNVARAKDGYLSTKGVTDYFVNNGLRSYKNIAVFAHPLHMYRCVKTLEKSLSDARSDAKILVPSTWRVPFDEKSVQPWTRNLRAWIFSEIISRINAIIKGDIIVD